MLRVLKWFGIGVGVLFLLTVAAGLGVYILSQRVIDRKYKVPPVAIAVPTDSASLVKGERLTNVYGCANSCHGKEMEGTVLIDEPTLASINAPNLTRILPEYSDAELELLLRRGVKRDGTSTWAMPTPMFARLTDEDLGAIIAYLRRAAPPRDGVERRVELGPLARIGIVAGKFKPHADQIAPDLPRVAKTDRSDPLTFGEYLVTTSCTECHGMSLEGSDLVKAPSLTVMAGYDDAAFEKLMRTGIGIGNRKLGLMTEVGETRFARMTDDEVNAMREYLRTRFPVEGDTARMAATN